MIECIFRETTNPNEKGFIGTEGTLITTKIDGKNYFVFKSKDEMISITHEIISNINDLTLLNCNEAWYQDSEGYEYKFYCTPSQQMRKHTNINNSYMTPQEEKVNKGLAVISFFIPIVGLILYLTQKNEKPKTAKACGKCALANIIIAIIGSIICFIASGIAMYNGENNSNEKESSYYSEEFNEDKTTTYDTTENIESTLPNINSEDEYNTDKENYNTNGTNKTLGGERQGYIKASGEMWYDFKDLDYESDEMIQFTNGSEIITMSYWDGTNASKIDVLNSITLAVQNSAQRNSNALYLQTDKFLYDDFYAETIYTVDHPDYKCFGMYFQSDKTHDMLFFSIESPNLSDSEFEKLVNDIINSHSFVSHKLEFKINK